MDLRSDAHDEFPPTYIIIQLSKRIKKEAANWLLNKISSARKLGGAELELRAQQFIQGERLTFHVSAGVTKLLELAEELEIKKKDRFGVLREFTVRELSEFTHSVDKDNLFTTAEKQVLVKHEIESLRALSVDSSIPGYPHLSLYEGQTIIPTCLKEGLLKQIFPLHDDEEIKKLASSWYMTMFSPQPFEYIRGYFGESIALYFQFLDFYTRSLVLPMILGFLQLFLYPEALPFFCIFNIIAASIFLELWRKKCTELAYVWGTIGMTSLDEPRPNFTGTMAPDPITGKLFPHYPRWKTTAKMYCVSMPAVMVCLLGAFCVMLLSFYVENRLREVPDTQPWVIALPSIIYAALISLMNAVYRKFANFLTEWENHRTQSQFDRHRVTKLVLFEFVNNFMSLFYVAFIIQDMDMLRSQLATLMIILQVINNVQEAILPLVIQSYTPKVIELSDKVKKKESKGNLNIWTLEDFPFIKALPSDHSAVIQARSESRRDIYDDPYDDYLELFVQFGYVFLFSAVYPMAAFWAVANNFFEIRCDAFKLCCVYQRPLARRVKDTGAWQRSFQALCSVAVVTNCALLCLSPKLKSWASEDTTTTEWVMYFVVLEHCILALRQILHYAIPDKPEWVRIALAKGNYLSKQALKMQRMKKKDK